MLIIGTTVFILVLLAISVIRVLTVFLGERVVGVGKRSSPVRSLGGATSGGVEQTGSFTSDPPPSLADVGEREMEPSRSGSRTSWVGNLLALLVIGIIGYGWWSGISLDKMVRHYTLRNPKPNAALAKTGGSDWTMVDGVRWFKVIGTDSAGIGYAGWVSECAFVPAPPVDDPETDDIFKKVGLPSMKERLEGAKRLRKINQSLKTALEER